VTPFYLGEDDELEAARIGFIEAVHETALMVLPDDSPD
jgi:hypothetical protein